MAGQPAITVCIATRGRPRLLTACLESLVAQVDPPSFEVLVAADLDPEVAAIVAAQFPLAAVAQMSDESHRPLPPSDKRNALVQRAVGDLLLFLDDDVVCHPRLLRRLVDVAAEHPEASVFGGPNVTPPASSLVQTAQGAVLGSIVASGPVRKRWGRHPAGEADDRYFTLCNLAVRRSAMVPFPLGMKTGEEIAVLNELRSQGRAMWYDPDLLVFHERRATVGAFARQVFFYGRGRGWVIRAAPATIRPDHVAPVLLLGYLLSLPVLAFASPTALLPAAVYAVAVAAQAVKIGGSISGWRPAAAATAALAALLIVLVHVTYGAGLIAGVVGRGPRTRQGSTAWAKAAP